MTDASKTRKPRHNTAPPDRTRGIAFAFSTSGQIVPNCFPLNMAPGGISPVAAYRSEQPGAVYQGCISTAVYRRLALDWRPRLFYFPAVRRGYILQSRTLSHGWERAGGLGWIRTEVYLWTLPTVPMSAWWKRSHIKKHPPRRRHRKERLVRGVLIGGELAAFSAIERTSKSRADVWTFSPKKRPICKGFQPRFMMG